MPKHCSGIGINLFVQSKERNLFINVYFGAGSSLGCYKICIDRSSLVFTLSGAIHSLAYSMGYGSSLKAVCQSLYDVYIFFVVWCLVIIYSISPQFIIPPLTQQLLHQYIVPPYSFRGFWDINFSFILFKFIFLGNLDIFSLEDQKLRHMKYRYLNNIWKWGSIRPNHT